MVEKDQPSNLPLQLILLSDLRDSLTSLYVAKFCYAASKTGFKLPNLIPQYYCTVTIPNLILNKDG